MSKNTVKLMDTVASYVLKGYTGFTWEEVVSDVLTIEGLDVEKEGTQAAVALGCKFIRAIFRNHKKTWSQIEWNDLQLTQVVRLIEYGLTEAKILDGLENEEVLQNEEGPAEEVAA